MEFRQYRFHDVRAAAILTTAVVAGTIITECDSLDQMIMLIDFTLGSLTSVGITVEFAHDTKTPNWFQQSTDSIAGGTNTHALETHVFTATGKYAIAVPFKCSAIRLSAQGVGTVTGSSLAMFAITGNA